MMTATEDDDERIFAALRAGAGGLLVKDSEPAELVRAVAALAKGEALLSPSLHARDRAQLVAFAHEPGLRAALSLDGADV
jgi:DNA-binding response OmpR family regulator